jgi:hypothetical protein
MNLFSKIKNKDETTLFFLSIIPIFIFYRFVFIHSINVPYLDDFQILNTVVRVQDSPQNWLAILLENFNGHRFGEIKLLVWFDYLIEGQVNFKTLCIFGSFFLLGFWLFCVKIIKENNIPLFYLLPFTLILFQPIFHRNIFWMLSCLQYQQSIFFTIAAYYFLAKYTTKSFTISVILGIIHTQINGNAVYIFMLGALIPLYQGRYKMTLIYCSIGLVTGILFYHGMPTVVGLAGYSLHDLITSKPKAIFGSLGGFLGGSIYQFTKNNLIIGIFGFVIFLIIALTLTVFIMLTIKHIYKKLILKNKKSEAILLKYDEVFRQRIIIILMAGSLLLTALGVAISRGIFQDGVMLVERYFLYSVVSIGVTYLLAIMLTEGRFRVLVGIVALPLSLLFCWNSYYQAIPQVIYFEKTHEADIYDLKHHRTTNNKMFGFGVETLTLFEKTLARKIYSFPANRFDTLENKLTQSLINQSELLPQFIFKQTNENIEVYGGVKVIHFYHEKFTLSQTDSGNTFFVVLKNENNNDVYLIAPLRFSSLRKDFLVKNLFFGSGFSFIIQQDSVKKGRYRIGLLIFEDGKTELRYTSNIVNIDNTKMIDYLQQFGFYL